MPTLRDRLPADLRDAPSGPDFDALPFTSLYLLDDEWAAEIANRTMHGVMHVGWVPDETGGYRGQMAVLVKPNGLLGTAYMAAIRPFRHLIVYPAMMRQIEREWAASGAGADGRLDPIGRIAFRIEHRGSSTRLRTCSTTWTELLRTSAPPPPRESPRGS